MLLVAFADDFANNLYPDQAGCLICILNILLHNFLFGFYNKKCGGEIHKNKSFFMGLAENQS